MSAPRHRVWEALASRPRPPRGNASPVSAASLSAGCCTVSRDPLHRRCRRRTARWRYVSPQIEAILGFTPEEWCDDPELWASRLHPDDRAARNRAGEPRSSSSAPAIGARRVPAAAPRRARRLGARRRAAGRSTRRRPALARRDVGHHRAEARPRPSSSAARPSRRRSPGSASTRSRAPALSDLMQEAVQAAIELLDVELRPP